MKSLFRAEFHIHTVLSPCAEVEMIPPFIVQEALEKSIRLIAITDHNATANIAAVQKAAAGYDLTVLPGMEVQTREEVHSLCLFDTLEQSAAWQAIVDAALPLMQNRPDYFGEQFVVDETGDFIRREERMLAISVDMGLEDAFHEVTRLGGLFIPAHVNRRTFGLLANLGLVPTDIALEALEISRQLPIAEAVIKFPQLRGYPLIQSGDVHRLEEFLGANYLTLQAPTIAEIRLALQGKEGRSLEIK
ncbi:MAG TPA: PHP domain-containing protein [Anaerolineaceae bacterium]|nr:PHP domain-containing protein [Anaerolineaceae bacterium]